MQSPEHQIQQIHSTYCKLSGSNQAFKRAFHEQDWARFIQHYTAADLALVISYLHKLYRDKPEILNATLRFRHLIRQLDYFDEYLGEARARSRPKAPGLVEKVVGQTHRLVANADMENTSKQAGEILSRTELAGALKKWREENR